MKKLLLFIPLLYFMAVNVSSSQNFILYGDKAFGTYGSDFGDFILYAGNNQLILAGESRSFINGDQTDPRCDSTAMFLPADIWMLKIDTGFHILWNKCIGGEGAEFTSKLVMDANSNKIIFSCSSMSDSACEKTEHNRGPFPYHSDYWICSIDTAGTEIWDKTFGGAGINNAHDNNPQIIELTSGNFIIAGGSNAPVSGDKTVPNYSSFPDYWIVKTDSLRNKLWDKVYGGTGTEYDGTGYGNFTREHEFSILPELSDNFLLTGTTNSPLSGDISDTSRGLTDIWLIKIDSAGNKIWDKRYGGTDEDRVEHIIHTDDGGYILCGFTNSPQGLDVSDTSRGIVDCWVIKLDSLGNKQWDKRYGGIYGDVAYCIQKAPGGGYWVSGISNSPIGFEITENPYGTQGDYWIFKIDNSGNKLWDKRFGGPGINAGGRFIIMPDTSIFLFGLADAGISPVKTDSGKGDVDYWVVHFKYTDNTISINENTSAPGGQITISPNPTKGKFILTTSSKEKGNVFIYDAIGIKIYLKQDILLHHFEIDISSFSKGVYFLKVKSGEDYFLKKVVKM